MIKGVINKQLARKYTASIVVNGYVLPVEVVIEARRGSRFSMTRQKIIMREPVGVTADYIQSELLRLQEWVEQLVKKKPAVLAPFLVREYNSGQVITVGNRRYTLEVEEEDRKAHTAKLIGDTIVLRLSLWCDPVQRQKAIQTLLSRVVASDFYPEIVQRVHTINRQTVNRPIGSVYLKHNQSNWGSCSSSGNVNLSTRLLFAPESVQDYVIIHELAHLVEMNHSSRFWALVERFMPDYVEKERWLKENGGWCSF